MGIGVNRRTPEYMVREKLQGEKLRDNAGKRAWEFKKRLEEGNGSELARKCWRELRGVEREKPDWSEKRRGRVTLRIVD